MRYFALTISLICSLVLHALMLTHLIFGSELVAMPSIDLTAALVLRDTNSQVPKVDAEKVVEGQPLPLFHAQTYSKNDAPSAEVDGPIGRYQPGFVPELPSYFAELGDDRYWPHSLDRRPTPLDLSELEQRVDLPSHAIGSVALVVLISDIGVVEGVYLDSSQLPVAVTEEILRAMYFVRFVPGEKQELRVKSVMRMVLDFGFKREFMR